MFDLPYRLASRARLVASEVAEQFAGLVAILNGGLTAANFSRRAGIRNVHKAAPMAVVPVQCRVRGVAGAALPNPGIVRMRCLAPRRTATTAWVPFRMTYHCSAQHDWAAPGGGSVLGPISGTFRYGGADGLATAIALVDGPSDTILIDIPPAAALGFADVVAQMELTAGAAGLFHVLTVWYKAQHVR